MRNAFAKAITKIASKNKKVVLLSGDIGNRLFLQYKELQPKRFYNCGIAEATMTGVAAGLASGGFQPVTYTITPFNTVRCLEQIRLDICYPNLPVIIVGTGSGLSYANLGATHHSMEDIAILRVLPNLNILCPSDPVEVELALQEAIRLKKPTYIRLGKKGEPIVNSKNKNFNIGKVDILKKGKNTAIISVGSVLSLVLKAEKIFQRNKISPTIINLRTIKPLDQNFLRQAFKDYKKIIIVEEHGLSGGAGSAILEWGVQNKVNLNKIICIGGPDKFLTSCGNQEEARKFIGLTAENIYKRFKNH
jgi:transketolase